MAVVIGDMGTVGLWGRVEDDVDDGEEEIKDQSFSNLARCFERRVWAVEGRRDWSDGSQQMGMLVRMSLWVGKTACHVLKSPDGGSLMSMAREAARMA